jgi:Family of unknown function (DUF6502)
MHTFTGHVADTGFEPALNQYPTHKNVMPQNFEFLPLLRHLLIRLVRIAISCGITFQTFAKVLRSVYFDVGTEFEPVKGKPNSDSRISLLTGLPRRDIRAMRECPTEPIPPTMGVGRLVLHAWSSNLDLLDKDGNMLPLARTFRKGGVRSFESLVESVSTDLRARSLLDEWLRKGFVVLDDQDRVVIAHRRPADAMEGADGARLLVGEMIGDLLGGFERSYLLGQPVPGFSFQVVYGHGLTEESAQLVCATALREGTLLANRINRLVVERETLDALTPGATFRVSFGFSAFPADSTKEPGLLDPGRKN